MYSSPKCKTRHDYKIGTAGKLHQKKKKKNQNSENFSDTKLRWMGPLSVRSLNPTEATINHGNLDERKPNPRKRKPRKS